MGMYDREPNFEEHFSMGDRVVLTKLEYTGKINTSYGEAERTLITLVTKDTYPSKATYSALGVGFANQARRAEAKDFPHVAEYVRIDIGDGKAVKRFAKVEQEPKAFIEGEEGPPVTLDDALVGAHRDAVAAADADKVDF